MNIHDLSIPDLMAGYSEGDGGYTCFYCGTVFEADEIYRLGERFFTARRAVQAHVGQAHGGPFAALLEQARALLSLTEKQEALLLRMQAGVRDQDIAQAMGVSPSTVRHQRHMFRERAKAARLFLALWGIVDAGKGAKNEVIPIHEGATMVDERYMITPEEHEKIKESMFSSLSPLRLRQFSPREKKKIVILRTIAAEFEAEREYTEKEVNAVLREIYDDFVTLRRYLIEYGFMARTPSGSAYWKK